MLVLRIGEHIRKWTQPFADFAQFEKNPDIKDISDLFTVQLITKYIQNKLEVSHPNKECKQRFAATA